MSQSCWHRGQLLISSFFGSFFGLLVAVIKLFTSDSASETRATPNQGTRRSIRIAIGVLFLSILLGGPLLGLFLLSDDSELSLSDRLLLSVCLGWVLGLVSGLLSGGLFSIRHYALRVFLW